MNFAFLDLITRQWVFAIAVLILQTDLVPTILVSPWPYSVWEVMQRNFSNLSSFFIKFCLECPERAPGRKWIRKREWDWRKHTGRVQVLGPATYTIKIKEKGVGLEERLAGCKRWEKGVGLEEPHWQSASVRKREWDWRNHTGRVQALGKGSGAGGTTLAECKR